ncbi:MAG: sulfur carrier protein ThiS [Pseudomonadota bacterium]
MNNTIEVIINGFPEKILDGTTIAELILRFQEGDIDLMVELNHRFVYPRHYSDTTLSNGDQIEFINPNFGG